MSLPDYRDYPSVARPGDEDLDFDCDGLTINGVVTLGSEVIVSFAPGGFGRFESTEGVDCVMVPGDPNSGLAELGLVFGTHDADVIRFSVEVLEDWQSRQVPLRLCCAPGKPSTISEDETRWLVIPRS